MHIFLKEAEANAAEMMIGRRVSDEVDDRLWVSEEEEEEQEEEGEDEAIRPLRSPEKPPKKRRLS